MQKTAYEMRISDWSSDVCSSDLQAVGLADEALFAAHRPPRHEACGKPDPERARHRRTIGADDPAMPVDHRRIVVRGERDRIAVRSEEHTSELQSLMRI